MNIEMETTGMCPACGYTKPDRTSNGNGQNKSNKREMSLDICLIGHQKADRRQAKTSKEHASKLAERILSGPMSGQI